ncbi:non-contractile tail sheath protein, partial [Citrobacter freundii]|uniref:non-contractile tail sheath protein n=1 Tax=Citrobacter freundii TaxID=546 RepID=UPI0021C9311F
YSYPNFDYMMTEAYDWLLEARLDLAHQAVSQIPIQGLGYPANKVVYLSGFVPDASIAYLYGFDKTKPYRTPSWQRLFGEMTNLPLSKHKLLIR